MRTSQRWKLLVRLRRVPSLGTQEAHLEFYMFHARLAASKKRAKSSILHEGCRRTLSNSLTFGQVLSAFLHGLFRTRSTCFRVTRPATLRWRAAACCIHAGPFSGEDGTSDACPFMFPGPGSVIPELAGHIGSKTKRANESWRIESILESVRSLRWITSTYTIQCTSV